jgi:endonuclease YncB( thermonuclease family)
MRTVLVTLAIAALLGTLFGVGPRIGLPFLRPSYSDTITGCHITDGDTIRCGDERIRLLGIDAPEMPGHCRQGRVCVEGDPHASSASLAKALTGTLRIRRMGQDRYGRTLAIVAGERGDLSCWQLAHKQAVYVAKWDNGSAVARLCPSSI